MPPILAVIAGVLLPIVSSMAIGFARRNRAKSAEDYFVAGRSVSAEDFANTSVGYAIQMAVVMMIVVWTAFYGWGALWYIVTLVLGYVVVWFALPALLRFRAAGAALTLHEYLRLRFGSERLQRLAAIATITCFAGTLVVEVDVVVQMFAPLLHVPAPILTLGLLLAGTLYVLDNGLRAEIAAQTALVPLAYFGFIGLIVMLVPAVTRHAGNAIAMSVLVTAMLSFAAIAVARIQTRGAAGLRSCLMTNTRLLFLPLVGIAVFACAAVFTAHVPGGEAATVFAKPAAAQSRAQGFWGLASLIAGNLVWMITDLATWQRISAVEGSEAVVLANLRRGVWRTAVESPASWAVAFAFGMAVHSSGLLPEGGDAYSALGDFAAALAAGPSVRPVLLMLLAAASVAVLFSTVSGLVSAISFTAVKDIVHQDESTLAAARRVSIVTVLVAMVAFYALKHYTGSHFLLLLFAAYAVQNALIVVVLAALFAKGRLSARAGEWSVYGGFVGSGAATLLAALVPGPTTEVMAPLFAIAVALAGYSAGLFVDRSGTGRR